MPTAVQNLIVLGDSLSDVGNKREAPTGLFARALKAMRTNEIGRFSDGKNWTDFLVEWTGAGPLVRGGKDAAESATLPHRSLTTRSMLLKTDTNANPPLFYANYAEGGAIAASDWKPKAGALGYLKDEIEAYLAARRAMGANYRGHTLHIIWIGLNDIVTAERGAGLVMGEREVYRVGYFESNKDGTGITPIIEEIKGLVDSIANASGNRDQEHFLLIDLPSPTISIRFLDQIADGKRKQVDKFEANTVRFNDQLDYLATHWPSTAEDPGPGAKKDNITLVRMNAWMKFVAEHQDAFDLKGFAQEHGVPVHYLGQRDPVEPVFRRFLTTSDLAHPTEAVYQLIARKIAEDLLTKYTLGKLTAQTWPALRPYPAVVPE
ncbi:SGNH/GDSL hydrolase family protein [Nocardia brasiliensis]|uniref:SGNH/GDSL hydrolase family protein n=1 Tax=Nocardia brasiliensis TaxID=37326 RepID=UPI0024545ABD|nr:SGNH/GDSL hydrolase family protein [Nocardia brasiliensis]